MREVVPCVCCLQHVFLHAVSTAPQLCGDVKQTWLIINNSNNSHDNVYGAVITTKVIARVHPVHLMNVD